VNLIAAGTSTILVTRWVAIVSNTACGMNSESTKFFAPA
jgi:hypothetical protein